MEKYDFLFATSHIQNRCSTLEKKQYGKKGKL